MTDFKKLLENGCMIENYITCTNHLTENESSVLSILITHPAETDYDNFNFSFCYDLNMETLVELAELNEEELIEALNRLEEKGYIEAVEDSEQIIVYLKPYDSNTKLL